MKQFKIFIKRIIPRKYHSKISYLYNYLKSIYLFSFKYQCNFCKGHFRRLLPKGLKNDIAINFIGGGIVMLYVLDAIQQIERDWFIGI